MLVLLTLDEAAALVGYHPVALRQAAKRGTFIQPVMVPGRKVRLHFDQAEIYRWLAKREVMAALTEKDGQKKGGCPAKGAKRRAKKAGDRRRGWPSIATQRAAAKEATAKEAGL